MKIQIQYIKNILNTIDNIIYNNESITLLNDILNSDDILYIYNNYIPNNYAKKFIFVTILNSIVNNTYNKMYLHISNIDKDKFSNILAYFIVNYRNVSSMNDLYGDIEDSLNFLL
jgi:hypothetical protein